MRAGLVILIVLIAVTSLGDRAATAPVIQGCQVRVIAPSSATAGDVLTFTAEPAGYQQYTWTVSSGDIVGGQNSPVLTVSTPSAGSTCTATVEIMNAGCRSSASAGVSIFASPSLRKFDEFGDLRLSDEKARLDGTVFETLQNEPTTTAYFIIYGRCQDDFAARKKRILDHLVKFRGVDENRLQFIEGQCARDLKIEVWMAPAGATAPVPQSEEASVCGPCPKKKPTKRKRRYRQRPAGSN